MKYDSKSGAITFANVRELTYFANNVVILDYDGDIPETNKEIDYDNECGARGTVLDVERALGLKPQRTREEGERSFAEYQKEQGMVPSINVPGGWVTKEQADKEKG